MKLYIANSTKQHHYFHYNHPGKGRRHPLIKAGSQVLIGDDLSADQIALIVNQYEIYGIRNVAEMSRLHGFVGFSYSIDKPVPVDAMLSLYEINDSALNERARERRTEEAAAVSDAVADSLARQGGVDRELMRPEHLEIQNREDTDGKPSISEGVEVGRTPEDAPRRQQTRKRA